MTRRLRPGVTVVASSGDGGVTSTIGSPATDQNVLSVGATTTLRGYEQTTLGGVNAPGANGRIVNNNISSFSSAGFSGAGRTVDLVAPGDLNWALCSPNDTLFTECTNFSGTAGSPIELTGGTSESSPLAAGAAADVIQAYADAHGGTDPTPAVVRQILMSSATDIDAPASQQGAGLLNIAAAVRLARSIKVGNANGGILVSPGQINVQQKPGKTASRTIKITNTSSHSVSVNLSTRALTKQVVDHSGTFCMQPGTPTTSCPANTGVLTIWSGVSEDLPEGDVQGSAYGAPVAAELLLRLPVHRTDVTDARRAVRAGRYLRGLLELAGAGRLRQHPGRQPAGGQVDRHLLHRGGQRHDRYRHQRTHPVGRQRVTVRSGRDGEPELAYRGRGRDRLGHAQGDQPCCGR